MICSLDIRTVIKNILFMCAIFLVLQTSDSVTTFDDFLSSIWQWNLHHYPEFATLVGVKNYSDKMESFTEEEFLMQKIDTELFLLELMKVNDTVARARDKDVIDVIEYELKTFIEGYNWHRYGLYNPINALEGVHKSYTLWLDATMFHDLNDVYNYFSRLLAFASQINEQTRLMQISVRDGVTQHCISMENVVDDVYSIFSVGSNNSSFIRTLTEAFDELKLSRQDRERLHHRGTEILVNHIFPALRRLYSVLSTEYITHCRLNASVSSLPNGYEYYKQRLQWYLSYAQDPVELHNLAMRAMSVVRYKINMVKSETQFQGSLHSFLRHMMTVKQFVFLDEDDLLKAYEKIIYHKLPNDLQKVFNVHSLPEILVSKMPFDGPLGVLMPASEGDGFVHTLFVNVQNPVQHPTWKIATTCLHETLPGKLLQLHVEQNIGLPKVLKYKDNRRLYAVPFHIPLYTAYTEGWALYAESLGLEIGLLQSASERFGQLYSELYHASLIVIDTGIHALGWSLEEAHQYLWSQTALDSQDIDSVIQGVITLPGHVIAPGFGYLLIHELRREAQAQLGAKFAVKNFHDEILQSGPVPLQMLRQKMKRWIKACQMSQQVASHSSKGYVILHCFLILVFSVYAF